MSASGKDAAEVDILLTKDGKEIGIFEGMKLNSVNADYIDRHISKLITNYNALGTATFIAVSYTHLDVYKRQDVRAPGCRSFLSLPQFLIVCRVQCSRFLLTQSLHEYHHTAYRNPA